MSSSKIFPKDSSFVPIKIVQQEITEQQLRQEQEEIFPVEETFSEPTEDNTVETSPEPEPETVEPAPPPPEPEPQIDLEALQLEAYNQGMADATARMEEELATTLSAFSAASQKIDTLHHALLERYRGDIINTIIGLCKKIIGKELTTSRDVIAQTLEDALVQAIADEEFIVTIHPDDLNTVENIKTDLIGKVRELKRLVIQTDREIGRGGCLVESKSCSVDATIATRLDSARDFLENTTLSFTDQDNDYSSPGAS